MRKRQVMKFAVIHQPWTAAGATPSHLCLLLGKAVSTETGLVIWYDCHRRNKG